MMNTNKTCANCGCSEVKVVGFSFIYICDQCLKKEYELRFG